MVICLAILVFYHPWPDQDHFTIFFKVSYFAFILLLTSLTFTNSSYSVIATIVGYIVERYINVLYCAYIIQTHSEILLFDSLIFDGSIIFFYDINVSND